MNILITGANGFIGKNLLKHVKNENLFNSDNLILLSNKKIDGYQCIEHKNYSFSKDDFLIKGINNIEILIHIGAFTPKTNSQANDIEKSYSNVKNTVYLLDNIPNVPNKIIFTSTIDVYKNTNIIIDENSETNPISLYGWSKLLCEKIIEQYGYQNNSIVQILRIGHIYGNGEEEYKN
jgi:nucleoside-diphosphate-sugar epimerase